MADAEATTDVQEEESVDPALLNLAVDSSAPVPAPVPESEPDPEPPEIVYKAIVAIDTPDATYPAGFDVSSLAPDVLASLVHLRYVEKVAA